MTKSAGFKPAESQLRMTKPRAEEQYMYTQTQVARAIQHHRYESSGSPDRHHDRRPLGIRTLLWMSAGGPPGGSSRRYRPTADLAAARLSPG